MPATASARVRSTAFALLALLLLAAPVSVAEGSLGSAGLRPAVGSLVRAGSSDVDLRALPDVADHHATAGSSAPRRIGPAVALQGNAGFAPIGSGLATEPLAPAPATDAEFEGLAFADVCTGGQCGEGHPPDTNGDVGPVYYIQTINVAIGIFDKATGNRIAAFTFNSFMSQGSFGNLCDTDNFGDPVVLYDSFHDRWVITDFAFQVDGAGNVLDPPGSYQCFAVSQSGDPVSGGWHFYSLAIGDALGDYPKLGIWPDGLYMSANMFEFPAGGAFLNARVWAFDLAAMEAGAASPTVVAFDVPAVQGFDPFSLLPGNARVAAGTPPAGRPNFFTAVHLFTDRIRVWTFDVDWSNPGASTFSGPTSSMTSTNWAVAPATVPSKDGNDLDTIDYRLMMQNQYSNVGGVESLWNSHTVQGGSASQAAIRWYQVPVTGGVVGAALQASTWNPGVASRFMPSLAVDRVGDLAIGYSVSSATLFPAIRYAGRLAGDPAGTLGQTEQSMVEGGGSQVGSCGGAVCTRWGDYTAMTLDPVDGCTFWYTNQYYAASGLAYRTRIGSFVFPSCINPPDVTPPTGSVVVAGGATFSNAASVTLDTASPDGDVTMMRISNTSSTSGGILSQGLTLAYAPTLASWDLTSATFGGTAFDGTKSVHVQWRDEAGNWSTPSSDAIVLDRTAPTVTKPSESFPGGYQLGSLLVPVRTTWSPSDALSGIAALQFQESIDGAAYVPVINSTPLIAAVRWFEPGQSVRFRVRAMDGAGNWSAWILGPVFKVGAAQESAAVVETGTWTFASAPTAYGGGLEYSSQTSASVTYSFFGRDVAWIAYRGATRGEADVYVDGTFVKRIDLYSATFEARRVVFTRSFSVLGPHTIKIVVVGTVGHPRVDLDAFLKLE